MGCKSASFPSISQFEHHRPNTRARKESLDCLKANVDGNQPTSSGTITLLLLRGPSENVVPLKPIAEGIPNTGSYVWTPDSSLEPDVSRYGIQLIQDSDGAYQYSTQFGISGDAAVTSAATSSVNTNTDAVTAATATNTNIYTTLTSATTMLTSETTLPLPTTTFFKYYNGSCHACPPHNQTTTVLNTETEVTAQATPSTNGTALPSEAPVPTTSAGPRTSSPAATTARNGTSVLPATGAAGHMVVPFASAAMGLVGIFVALLI